MTGKQKILVVQNGKSAIRLVIDWDTHTSYFEVSGGETRKECYTIFDAEWECDKIEHPDVSEEAK